MTVVWAFQAVPPGEIGLAVAFSVAWAMIDGMSVRLTRGDYVLIDGAVAIPAVAMLSPGSAVAACALGTAIGVLAHRSKTRSLSASWADVLRKPVIVLALAVLAGATLSTKALAEGAPAVLLICGMLGAVYSATDFALLVTTYAIDAHESSLQIAEGLGRPLLALYAAHVSLGAATALLIPNAGPWSLWAMVSLVLLSQYSFNLLLQTRRAYFETIQALMRASELRVDESLRGHSQRVADIAVIAGRMLGFASGALEQLNYAALLHEIGRIGMGDDATAGEMLDEHALRGAAIVANIPFLGTTQKMIAAQRELSPSRSNDSQALVCAAVIGAACDLDRAIASERHRWSELAGIEDVLPYVASVSDPDIRRCVAMAAVRVANRID